MGDRPLVSIGMPVFNCEASLALALRSMLAQTCENWELFLIDDGSTDKTLAVAGEFQNTRITCLADGRRLGLAARLNQAIDLSRGAYFARMDGDDLAYPERLERQVSYLEAWPEVDLLGTAMMVFAADGRMIGQRAGPVSHADICRRPTGGFRIFHPTYMGRLEWFRTHHYDPQVVLSQDQDLLLRTYGCSRFANLPEILLGYREARLDWIKMLRTRWFFAQSVVRQMRREDRLWLALAGIVEQFLEATLDTIAIGTGIKYHVLTQRARQPHTDLEVQRWQQVWNDLN